MSAIRAVAGFGSLLNNSAEKAVAHLCRRPPMVAFMSIAACSTARMPPSAGPVEHPAECQRNDSFSMASRLESTVSRPVRLDWRCHDMNESGFRVS